MFPSTNRLLAFLIGTFYHRMERLNKKERLALEAFSHDLTFPPRRTDSPLIVCMVGLVGSGKSLVARLLAEHIGAVALNADIIRMYMRKEGLGFDRARLLAEITAHRALDQGSNVVMDSDHIDAAKRASVLARAKKMGVRVVFVRTVCDLDIAFGNIMKEDYNHEDGPFFRDAASPWKDPSVSAGAVVKMREMHRRTWLHYDLRRSGGGQWVLKRTLPFPVFATIDTGKPHWQEELANTAKNLGV
ncbi:MAG: AAA family ATPase [Patescibacteria group bacterium]